MPEQPRSAPSEAWLIGLAGGLVGALAMNLFARVVTCQGERPEAEGAASGTDRLGRGVQPAQAERTASDDATVRVGAGAYEAATGDVPSPQAARQLGSAAHYAFGAAMGVLYGLLAPRIPAVRTCYGTLYGTAVWAVADEMTMPALGLSRGPRQLNAKVLAYGLVGHFVYASTLECVWRWGTRDRRS